MTHLVTGAGSGIGAIPVHRLLDRGDEVTVVARSPERAEEMAADLAGAILHVLDLPRDATISDLTVRPGG